MKYRVVLFSSDYYTIKYAFRWWHLERTIKRIQDLGTAFLLGWTVELFTLDEAKQFIRNHATDAQLTQFLEGQETEFSSRRKALKLKERAARNNEFEVDT